MIRYLGLSLCFLFTGCNIDPHKFTIRTKVEVVSGFYTGCVGSVVARSDISELGYQPYIVKFTSEAPCYGDTQHISANELQPLGTTDMVSCVIMCGSKAQGYSTVLQSSMGACICNNEEGRKVQAGYHKLLEEQEK